MSAYPIPFEDMICPEPTTGCWLYTGGLDVFGYGKVNYARYHEHLAHRVAWRMAKGDPAGDKCVLHRCDTPACVNPDHLFLGTRQDNNADMVRKGRQRSLPWAENIRSKDPSLSARGERNGWAVLTDDLVRDIRRQAAAGVSRVAIARQIGVTPECVGLVANRRTWRHVV